MTSYTATLALAFDGTQAGQPHTWSKSYVLLATTEPAVRQLTIEKTGNLANLETAVITEIDGTRYERRGETPCSAAAIPEGTPLGERVEPAGLLTGVIGADDAGSESIDGVAASHYTFDQRAFGQMDTIHSAGEMWVAAVGGHLLKYSLTTQANGDYFGDGIEGTLSLTYALIAINESPAIGVPQDCPAGMVDAPSLADAADVVDVPGLLSFTTSSSVAEATTFYQQQLPALGWQQTGDPLLGEQEAWLVFSRANQQLSVFITSGDGRTTVDVVVENTGQD